MPHSNFKWAPNHRRLKFLPHCLLKPTNYFLQISFILLCIKPITIPSMWTEVSPQWDNFLTMFSKNKLMTDMWNLYSYLGTSNIRNYSLGIKKITNWSAIGHSGIYFVFEFALVFSLLDGTYYKRRSIIFFKIQGFLFLLILLSLESLSN